MVQFHQLVGLFFYFRLVFSSMTLFYFKNKLIYANYGRKEDFEYLKSVGISVVNEIVMCRLGKGSRGGKVRWAYKYGAKAVLLYDDPLASASVTDQIYPNGIFLPSDGTQRGSLISVSGDPLSPNYPSTGNYNFI
jgi:N-acetylated-alpha-linked acidic dipeptidase